MRVLVDIVHPADVLFFSNPIRILQQRGVDVVIASRAKDVTIELLEDFQLEHTPVSRAGRGLLQLAAELVARDVAVARLARAKGVHVLTGFGGVAAAHAAFVLRKPSIIFYDTDTAVLQNRITYPFVTELHVPEWYEGPVPKARTHRFAGLKEQAYLDPERFAPDLAKATAAGLAPECPNFLLRVVGWGASHDVGRTGWSDDTVRALVSALAGRGRVHICSERALPPDLARLEYRGPAASVHHLMGNCDLYVGESVTMAIESCLLGVPAIFAAPFLLSNVKELQRRGLLRFVPDSDLPSILVHIDDLMSGSRISWDGARDALLAETVDVAGYVADALERAVTRYCRR